MLKKRFVLTASAALLAAGPLSVAAQTILSGKAPTVITTLSSISGAPGAAQTNAHLTAMPTLGVSAITSAQPVHAAAPATAITSTEKTAAGASIRHSAAAKTRRLNSKSQESKDSDEDMNAGNMMFDQSGPGTKKNIAVILQDGPIISEKRLSPLESRRNEGAQVLKNWSTLRGDMLKTIAGVKSGALDGAAVDSLLPDHELVGGGERVSEQSLLQKQAAAYAKERESLDYENQYQREYTWYENFSKLGLKEYAALSHADMEKLTEPYVAAAAAADKKIFSGLRRVQDPTDSDYYDLETTPERRELSQTDERVMAAKEIVDSIGKGDLDKSFVKKVFTDPRYMLGLVIYSYSRMSDKGHIFFEGSSKRVALGQELSKKFERLWNTNPAVARLAKNLMLLASQTHTHFRYPGQPYNKLTSEQLLNLNHELIMGKLIPDALRGSQARSSKTDR